jgi:ABC-type uncharacterized transport system permease subunit
MFEATLIAVLPLLFASLGGLITERAGTLNIALEGIILSSAFFTLYGADNFNSIVIGIILGIGISTFMALLFMGGTFLLKGDPFIIGLGINLSSYPLVSVASRYLYNTEGTVRPESIPSLPFLLFPIMGFFLFLLILYLIDISPWGLILKLCGSNEDRLREKGFSPIQIKSVSILTGSILAGLAGSFLSLNLAVFVPNMSAGKGWIALVAVYAGGKKVWGILPVILIFSFFDMAAVSLQRLDWLPSELVLSMPYFFSLVVLF